MGGQVGMINLGEIMGKALGGGPKKRRRLKVREAWTKLVDEEADKRLDTDDVNRAALLEAEQNGSFSWTKSTRLPVSDVRGGSSAARAFSAIFCR
jgi:ATP-dependent HslUV protease ATP-binding subunit HslU